MSTMTTLEDTVTTRYVGPSDTRGSFFVVRFRGHTHRVAYDYSAANAARDAAQVVVSRYVPGGYAAHVGETRTGNRYCVNVFGDAS